MKPSSEIKVWSPRGRRMGQVKGAANDKDDDDDGGDDD